VFSGEYFCAPQKEKKKEKEKRLLEVLLLAYRQILNINEVSYMKVKDSRGL